MEIARIRVKKNIASIDTDRSESHRSGYTQNLAQPTCGMRGAAVTFVEFSPEWTGLSKTAVFKTSTQSYDVVNISEGEPVTIPWEILQNPGENLMVGVCGTDAEHSIQLVSTRAVLGKIIPGANPSGRPSQPKTPDWTEQIETQTNQLLTEVRGIRPKLEQLEEFTAQAASSASGAVESANESLRHSRTAEDAAALAGQYLTDVEEKKKSVTSLVKSCQDLTIHAENIKNNCSQYLSQVQSITADVQGLCSRAEDYSLRAKKSASDAALAASRVSQIISDHTVSAETLWSSQKITDEISILFAESGHKVSCEPIPDTPLDVITELSPSQSGTGDPSATNYRPFLLHREIQLHHESADGGARMYTAKFTQDVPAGTLNWKTGSILPYKLWSFDGSEGWREGYTDPSAVTNRYILPLSNEAQTPPLCCCFPTLKDLAWDNKTNISAFCSPDQNHNIDFAAKKEDFPTITDWKAFLSHQSKIGKPVVICYVPGTPMEPIYAEGIVPILGKKGTNILYTDGATTLVSGKSNLKSTIQDLTQRIKDLEAAAIGGL